MKENNTFGHESRNDLNSPVGFGAGFGTNLTYLLVGGGIGATLALLFAPKPGNELRGEIADVTRKGYDATLEKAKGLKDQTAVAVQTVKEKARVAYDFAAKKLASNIDVEGDVLEPLKDVKGKVEHQVIAVKDELKSGVGNVNTHQGSSNF